MMRIHIPAANFDDDAKDIQMRICTADAAPIARLTVGLTSAISGKNGLDVWHRGCYWLSHDRVE